MANPEWDNYKTPAQRYSMQSDESGHSYFIPVEQIGQFEAWVQTSEDGTEDEYTGPDFSGNRIDGTFTFTDPRIE